MQRKRLHLGADAVRRLGYIVLFLSALGAHQLAPVGYGLVLVGELMGDGGGEPPDNEKP